MDDIKIRACERPDFLSFEQIASKNAYKGTPLQIPHNERDFLTEKAQFSFLDISEN